MHGFSTWFHRVLMHLPGKRGWGATIYKNITFSITFFSVHNHEVRECSRSTTVWISWICSRTGHSSIGQGRVRFGAEPWLFLLLPFLSTRFFVYLYLFCLVQDLLELRFSFLCAMCHCEDFKAGRHLTQDRYQMAPSRTPSHSGK